ncbi:hypothetical protein Hdeb2414_s0015g00448901 [Helianthus debilis subsp. tardiflorus]
MEDDEIQMEMDGAPSWDQLVPRGPRQTRPPSVETLQGHPYLEFIDGTPPPVIASSLGGCTLERIQRSTEMR